MKKIHFFMPLLLSMIFFTGEAFGCRCILPDQPVSDDTLTANVISEYNKALAVFSGKVVEIDVYRVKFEVEKVWRGKFEKEPTMSTGTINLGNGTSMRSSCDYNFEKGESYLVFAGGASTDEMKATKCGFTQPLKNSEHVIKKLNYLITEDKKVSLLHFESDFLETVSKL